MTNRQKIFGVMGAVLLSFAAGETAWAATYYVATNGSDSASGSESSPFRTIAYAVSRMNAGDTTYVRGGTYNEKRILFSKSGTESSPIKLLNAPGETPIINFGVNATNKLVHRIELNAPGAEATIGWITIEGFELGYGYDGIKFYNAHDVTIRRNWIHHVIAQGILGSGKNMLIDRNVISHNGDSKLDHGMYLTGSNYVITNNLIYANATFGLQVAGYPWDMSQYGGGGRKFTGHAGRPDPSYAGARGWLIANNTLAYNGAAGIVSWMASATNNRIVNNIFYENSVKGKGGSSTQGISFYNSGGSHTVQNNIFYATAPGGIAAIGGTDGWQSKYTESGNIVNTVNPNFEGAGATISGVPNFKLRAGSPAIDKGLSLSQVTWDHAGGKRPHGAAFDIGAYEFGSPPDSGSPPPNPTGGEYGSPGAPVLLGPNGEVCPTGYN